MHGGKRCVSLCHGSRYLTKIRNPEQECRPQSKQVLPGKHAQDDQLYGDSQEHLDAQIPVVQWTVGYLW
jgi:hypothetical protein